MKVFMISAAMCLTTGAAFADGHADASAGEDNFKKCQACHVVRDDDGNVLAGRSGKTGPNLFGVVGRQAGTLEGFRFKKSIVAAGEAGLVWDEAELTAYLLDPTGYLRDRLGDSSARSAMSFKFRKEQEAADMAAYLATFSQ